MYAETVTSLIYCVHIELLTRIPRIGCVAWQNRSQTRQIRQIIFPVKGYFRYSKCVNHQTLSPFLQPLLKFTLGIIQIIIKSLSTIISVNTSREWGESMRGGWNPPAHWRGVRGCSPRFLFKSMSLRMHFKPF